MSIIHVKTRNTASHERFEAQRSADNSMVFIADPASSEDFSIELTTGSNWNRRYGPNSNEMETIPANGIALKPNQSVVVEVAEAIRVPYNIYGLVIPTGSLFLDNGIIIAAAKIEPSFNGRLKLRLVNISGERRTVKPGQKVASAVFFSTDHTTFLPEKDKTIVRVTRLPGGSKRIGAWLSANRLHVIGWVIAILISSVSGNIIDRIWPPSPLPSTPRG